MKKKKNKSFLNKRTKFDLEKVIAGKFKKPKKMKVSKEYNESLLSKSKHKAESVFFGG